MVLRINQLNFRRKSKAEGMNARELTKFLVHYFNPQWALNMDGGGSTTMYYRKRIHRRGSRRTS
ncbi:MAG: phosphodiester glycosidase family protein [Muribaculaceae bacterium]|nr:phosphodiester glycosidase family protein [Muribaculaceae bacterium]